MIAFDKPLLDTFKSVELRAEDLDRSGRYTRAIEAANVYQLRYGRRSSLIGRDAVLSHHAVRREGDLWIGYNVDRYAVDVNIVGDGHARYCLVVALSGAINLVDSPDGNANASGTKGVMFRGLPGTRCQTTDDAERLAIWIDASRLERVLQARIGEPPGKMLAFEPGVDWAAGQTGTLWRLILHLVDELRDPAGLTTEPVAREAFTDLLLQTVLGRLAHNYTARLKHPVSSAVPVHVRRAEAFMHASADQPISMVDVAAAAGCGTATLYASFRRFRDTTPLSALHGIRLERVREALRTADPDVPTRKIARRFGFTNLSRFLAAYGKRFGEHPNVARRRDRGVMVIKSGAVWRSSTEGSWP